MFEFTASGETGPIENIGCWDTYASSLETGSVRILFICKQEELARLLTVQRVIEGFDAKTTYSP
jgi:hypothetical protein